MPQVELTEVDTQKPSLLKRGQDKASQMWVDWGKAQSGWKVTTKLRRAPYSVPSEGYAADIHLVKSLKSIRMAKS
jgi:hypothetical protein